MGIIAEVFSETEPRRMACRRCELPLLSTDLSCTFCGQKVAISQRSIKHRFRYALALFDFIVFGVPLAVFGLVCFGRAAYMFFALNDHSGGQICILGACAVSFAGYLWDLVRKHSKP
jgi:hypothetical protein